jgi:hypothetical protein
MKGRQEVKGLYARYAKAPMAPNMAAALMPKLEAAPVFSTGGEPPVTETVEASLVVAEGVPVEMVLLRPWLGRIEDEAEAAEVMTEVLTVVATVETSVDEADEEDSAVEYPAEEEEAAEGVAELPVRANWPE